MKKTLLLSALLALPAFATAQAQEVEFVGPQAGDWEVTISGSGSSDNDFDNTTLGVTGSAGKYMTDNVLVGVRQTLNFSDSEDNTALTGATRVFADYVFDLGRWRPYIGASAGGIYGEGVNNTFAAGPEVGVKYYADDNTFIYAQTEYQFTFQDSDDIDDAFDDGGFFHAVGVGFNF